MLTPPKKKLDNLTDTTLYLDSSTAGTQCFFNSLLNSSLDSSNFFFLALYVSSIWASSASNFSWWLVKELSCLFNTWILAVVTTLRTSGTVFSDKMSLIKRWLRVNLDGWILFYFHTGNQTRHLFSGSSGPRLNTNSPI